MLGCSSVYHLLRLTSGVVRLLCCVPKKPFSVDADLICCSNCNSLSTWWDWFPCMGVCPNVVVKHGHSKWHCAPSWFILRIQWYTYALVYMRAKLTTLACTKQVTLSQCLLWENNSRAATILLQWCQVLLVPNHQNRQWLSVCDQHTQDKSQTHTSTHNGLELLQSLVCWKCASFVHVDAVLRIYSSGPRNGNNRDGIARVMPLRVIMWPGPAVAAWVCSLCCVCVCVCVRAYTHMCVCVCVCMFVCMLLYTSVCILDLDMCVAVNLVNRPTSIPIFAKAHMYTHTP